MRALFSSRRRGLAYLISVLALTIVLAAGGALGVSAAAHQRGSGLARSVSRGSGGGITTGATPGGTVSVQQFAPVVIDAPSGTFQFDPAMLTIHKGTTVVWNNTTIAPHTATSDSGDPAPFDSGIINPGAGFSFTFTVVGTYTYHCNIHSFMHGTIVVTP